MQQLAARMMRHKIFSIGRGIILSYHPSSARILLNELNLKKNFLHELLKAYIKKQLIMTETLRVQLTQFHLIYQK